jgi:hypothetical protein
MSTKINIYCDESCHLENDGISVMVLGAVWTPEPAVKEAAARLVELKKRHGLSAFTEIKWVKVSQSKLSFYLDAVDYFFDNSALMFRSVVVPNKKLLNHESFVQSHDDWYYKMHFILLKQILSKSHEYAIYIDIKDSRSQHKVKKLHEVICKSMFDFDRDIVKRVQQVRSHEVQLLQLGDLLLGAVCYANRGLVESIAKLAVIQRIRERSGFKLTKSTLPSEKKFNVFVWSPSEPAF